MNKHLITAAVTTGLLFSALGSASADETAYTVRSGDSLWKISQTYNLTIDQLLEWNHLSSSTIYVNQNLVLVPPSGSTSAIAETNIYTVKSGDCLSAIAKTFNITVIELKSYNHLASDVIQIGQQLKIPGSNSTVSPVTTASGTSTYTVQSGDCLSVIASRYNLTVTELKTINHLSSDTIYIGQILNIIGTVSSTPVPGTSATAQTASTVSKAQEIINEAKKYIGTPYLWGGSTPAGFDCSGFVHYVFNSVGITIPRTVATIWGATTAIGTPKPGDLVFFETYQPGPSHVGIYLGDNKFIHAGSSGVTISDMTTTYWKSRYLGAKTAL